MYLICIWRLWKRSVPMDDIKICSIVRSKRKSIAFIINDEAQLIVRAPKYVSDEYINNLVNKKRQWILQKQQLIKKRNRDYKPKDYVDGEEFLILGKNYRLSISKHYNEIFVNDHHLIFPVIFLDKPNNHMLMWYKKMAKEIISIRVKDYAELLSFKYNKVKITNARKRWGSCSSQGNLNFSWRLYMAPIEVIDYVVIHELVHTEIPNHSKEYWKRVRAIMPDYEKCKQWLNNNQSLMNLI